MKRLRSRRGRLVLWLAMLALLLNTGCGVWTTGGEAQQETMDRAISAAASPAAESSKPMESVSGAELSEPEASAPGEKPSKPVESVSGAESSEPEASAPVEESLEPELLDEDGSYTSCEDVALYLETYERLPGNFITKKEAQALGWTGGSLEPYAPGKCIGGDRFGNYEKLLPEAEGRSYRECDIDTLGADSRGAKRIVYSDDGLIYYTEDHYASFTLLYD
ncbi:MAG: hypothetical protein NC399_02715 [Muribaculum sp.]|nr:hypothetical protein [Muribaculum sp.]